MNRKLFATLSLEALSDLGEARQEWVSATIALVHAKRDLARKKAIGEHSATVLAGGPKGLGSNAELRAQALVIALEKDPDYMAARLVYDEAFEVEARTKQGMYTLKDTLDLFKILIETGV